MLKPRAKTKPKSKQNVHADVENTMLKPRAKFEQNQTPKSKQNVHADVENTMFKPRAKANTRRSRNKMSMPMSKTQYSNREQKQTPKAKQNVHADVENTMLKPRAKASAEARNEC